MASVASASAKAAVGKGLSIATDYGIDLGFGALSASQRKDGYQMAGDIVGIGANFGVSYATSTFLTGAGGAGAAAGAGAGGAGAGAAAAKVASVSVGVIASIVLIVAQVVGAILDAAWNPFKNFYNADIENIRNSIKQKLKSNFAGKGLFWPLEVKPDFLNSIYDETHPNHKKDLTEFQNLVKQYYDDNGLITKEEVLKEEKLLNTLLTLKRMSNKVAVDNNGQLFLVDPTLSAITLLDSDNNNMLLLTTLALAIKQKKNVSSNNFFRTSMNFLQYNWQILTSIILLFILSFFSMLLLNK
jgi:hypothetical protein